MTSGKRVRGQSSTAPDVMCDFNSRTWSGGDDPDHVLPQNYTVTYVERFDRSIGKMITKSSGKVVRFNTFGPYAYWTTSMFAPLASNPNFKLNLMNRIAGKIRGSNLNLSVSLAEGAETLTMLKQSGTAVLNSVIAFKRGNYSRAVDHLVLGNKLRGRRMRVPNLRSRVFTHMSLDKKWLSWQYGWKPLLNDVYEATQAIDKLYHSKFSDVSRVVVHNREFAQKQSTFVGTAGWKLSGTATTIRTAQIIAYVDNPASAAIAASVGVLDPATVGWEVLPYSFVVDWFIPIGTYLETRGIMSQVSATYVYSEKNQKILTNPVFTTSSSYTIQQDQAYWRDTTFSRVVSTEANIVLPSFRNPLGFNQVASGFSLLSTKFHR